MLSDLDRLMRERAIDAVIVPMHEAAHASFRWLSRGAKLTRGYAVKLHDRAPVLVTYPMEREEALATGLEVHLAHEYCSTPDAYDELFANMLRTLGAGESIAFFGNVPIHLYLGIADSLAHRGWRVHRSNGEDLIQLARKRKESGEIDAIRSVGARTEQVVDGVRALLRQAERGRAMTIGDLKAFVSQEIARLGMIEDHETILSQGRDAGVPHSRGDANAPLRMSVPLVLDIFPADKNSGYFFDLTRTFCIGPIPTNWYGPTRRCSRHSPVRAMRSVPELSHRRTSRSSATISNRSAIRRSARIRSPSTDTYTASDTAWDWTSTRCRRSR